MCAIEKTYGRDKRNKKANTVLNGVFSAFKIKHKKSYEKGTEL